MPSVRISKELKSGTYFLTITVKNWYYVLDRYRRWDILAESIQYFQKEKGLKLFGFIFMTNHIHLLVGYSDMIAFVRDFKRFTSKEIHKNIKRTEPSILKLFETEEGNNISYEFWAKTNMPKGVESEKYFFEKLKYIHENPVRRNYVALPEYWYWSSANPDCELKVDNCYE